jgi:hypothetical protein
MLGDVREWVTPAAAPPRLRLPRLLPRPVPPLALLVVAGLGVLLLALAAGLLAQRTAHTEAQATLSGRNRWLAGDTSRLPAVAAVSGIPQEGAIFVCQSRFPGGGGAFAEGPWLKPDGTFNLAAKPLVDGAIEWTGRFSITLDGATRTFAGNGLPSHVTGVFPIARTDDAYAFDRNPNSIRAIPISVAVPADPVPAAAPSCLPLGPIGVLRTGAVLFNALDAAGRDAVAHEIQDTCFGHPGPGGAYHYHSLTPCLADAGVSETPDSHSPLVGYAFDGFGIFGPRGEGGIALATSDLDECHGHTHEIEWDGRRVTRYHYHATWSYPYTLGCFHGVSSRAAPPG